MKKYVMTLTMILLMVPRMVPALMFQEPSDGKNVVGRIQYVDVEPGDDFITIAQRFDVGYYELVESNRDADPKALTPWDQLLVPTRFILPPGTRSGILVNLAELRLYYFQPGTGRVYTFPVGVGREGWGTPVCLTSITIKTENPTWHVPESIRADRAKDGVELPKVVPPGPDNPLGKHSLRLAVAGGTYLIHGTNDPSGVGRRSSSGCIRMFPEDIEELFGLVPKGTLVQIINEPYKVGWDGTRIFLEAHVPINDDGKPMDLAALKDKLAKIAREHHVGVNWPKVLLVIKAQNGLPTVVSTETGEDIPELPEKKVLEKHPPVKADVVQEDSVSEKTATSQDESHEEAAVLEESFNVATLKKANHHV